MLKPLDEYTKKDWLSANTHGGITPDMDIYRIFRTDYLLHDILNETNTLVNPCYETQGDTLENPLKSAKFGFEENRYELFKSLMAEYYTQSWSLSDNDWGSFGGGHDTIRVKCKASALFERLVDEADPFYSLYYHMGLVSYAEPKEIINEMNKSDFGDFMDSRGYELLKTVLRIRTDFQKEKEVRLVYIRSPRENYKYPLKNGVIGNESQFCAHRFDWNELLEEYETNPKNKSDCSEIVKAIEKIRKRG